MLKDLSVGIQMANVQTQGQHQTHMTRSHPLVQRNVQLKRYTYALLFKIYQVVYSNRMCLNIRHPCGLIGCLMALSVVH